MVRRRWTVWAAGIAGGLLAVAPLLAKPGMVVTKYGTFEGDVDTATQGRVVVTGKGGIKTTIASAEVEKVLYFGTPREEFDAKMGRLTKNDVAGRLALAKWAIDQKQHDMAKEALDAAAAIDANNTELKSLQQSVAKQSGGQPAATQPARPGDDSPVFARRAVAAAKRTVTAAEINRIRQAEWRAGDRGVRVKLPPDVRKKFIDSGAMDAGEASRLQPIEAAFEIIQRGSPELRDQITLTTDPAPLLQFRKSIDRIFQTGCIQCHTVGKVEGNNRFALFPGDSEQAAYSNFLVFQQFTKEVKGTEYAMIDRTRPDGSLVLQYLLPPDAADQPHPEAKPYRGLVRLKSDPKYRDTLNWILSLTPIAPAYDIDLSAEALGGKAPAVAPATARAPATRPAVPAPPARQGLLR